MSTPTRPAVQRLQRDRILASMVFIVATHGYKAASVDAILKHSRVSRRAFYHHFDSIEDCFSALLHDGLARTSALIADAFEGEESWEDGVRAALSSLLVYFDSEPLLARVWLIEALAAGSWAFEFRERSVAALRSLVVHHWTPPLDASTPSPDSPPVVGIMAAVIGVLHTHLLTARPEPLITLLGPLMGIVTSPYLGPAEAAREVRRGEDHARELLSSPYPPPCVPAHAAASVEVPSTLLDPRAHRARECLVYLLSDPGACNREIALSIGVSSHSQISALLARLSRDGLLVKVPGRPGHPNAWSLSVLGAQVARALDGLELDPLRDSRTSHTS